MRKLLAFFHGARDAYEAETLYEFFDTARVQEIEVDSDGDDDHDDQHDVEDDLLIS